MPIDNKENLEPYQMMATSPVRKRKKMTGAEDEIGFTPNSHIKSAKADANIWAPIRDLLEKAKKGEGFIFNQKNILVDCTNFNE